MLHSGTKYIAGYSDLVIAKIEEFGQQIKYNKIRLSVGIEDSEDLKKDIAQAIAQLQFAHV